jgi:hypothetical protein
LRPGVARRPSCTAASRFRGDELESVRDDHSHRHEHVLSLVVGIRALDFVLPSFEAKRQAITPGPGMQGNVAPLIGICDRTIVQMVARHRVVALPSRPR